MRNGFVFLKEAISKKELNCRWEERQGTFLHELASQARHQMGARILLFADAKCGARINTNFLGGNKPQISQMNADGEGKAGE